MNTQRDFTKTKAALAQYDAMDDELNVLLDKRASTKTVLDYFARLEAAALAVGKAYVSDTSDINSACCATSVKPSPWLRRMIGVPFDKRACDGRIR